MKQLRTTMLAGVIFIALIVAIVPALAVDPPLNNSFMGDANNDNIPDKWNVKGDVFRTCDHPFTAYTTDDCIMVFPPSSKTAALWQRANLDIIIIVGEEGSSEFIGSSVMGAKKLDSARGYYGLRLHLEDSTTITLYDEIPGGNYPFDFYLFYDTVGPWIDGLSIPEATWGILMFPGDGYLGVDRLTPPIP